MLPFEINKLVVLAIRDPQSIARVHDSSPYFKEIMIGLDFSNILKAVIPKQYAPFDGINFINIKSFDDIEYLKLIFIDKCSKCGIADSDTFLNFQLRLCPKCTKQITIQALDMKQPFDSKLFKLEFKKSTGSNPTEDRAVVTVGLNSWMTVRYFLEDYLNSAEKFLSHPLTPPHIDFRRDLKLLKYSSVSAEIGMARKRSIRRICIETMREKAKIERRYHLSADLVKSIPKVKRKELRSIRTTPFKDRKMKHLLSV